MSHYQKYHVIQDDLVMLPGTSFYVVVADKFRFNVEKNCSSEYLDYIMRISKKAAASAESAATATTAVN